MLDAETNVATMRRLVEKLLHEAIGTGRSTQVYALWGVLDERREPLRINVARQELHRCSVRKHEANREAAKVLAHGALRRPPKDAEGRLQVVNVSPKGRKAESVHMGHR